MKICGIYKITSPSKKIYIGRSVDIIDRWRHYKKYNCESQRRLYNSFKKYSVEKHKFEILCQCDKSELQNLEKYYIDLYQTFNSDFGLNLRDSGDYLEHSQETKEKISAAQIGRKHKPVSLETREKISKSLKGKNTWSKGVSSPNKGIKTGKPAWNSGLKMDEQFCKKVSDGLKNKKMVVWNKGKSIFTDENKEYLISNFGIKKQSEMAKELNVSRAAVCVFLKKYKNKEE